MKVTANLSFAGAELAMFRGEVRDVPEYIADPLLKCGYLAVVEPAAANSSEMTKNELIQKAELEDLAYAVKVMAAEMIDNRQITAQYTGKNPMVMQILDLHSANLLPSEG